MNPHPGFLPLSALPFALLSCFATADPPRDTATAPTPALREFSARVQQYVTLRRRLATQEEPLKQTTDAAEINERRRALADAVRQARSNAKPGDIFTPAVAPYFRHIIRADVKETGTGTVGAAAPEKPKVPLRVNSEYPEQEPLSSVPPVMLSRLPRLPDELEYRFVGQHLLLRDRKANLIVDFLPDASPPNL